MLIMMCYLQWRSHGGGGGGGGGWGVRTSHFCFGQVFLIFSKPGRNVCVGGGGGKAGTKNIKCPGHQISKKLVTLSVRIRPYRQRSHN